MFILIIYGTSDITMIIILIGAVIGTYGGALFAAKRQERRIKELRQMAIKALKILQKYARNKQTYGVAASDFNNALSLAGKKSLYCRIAQIRYSYFGDF